MPALGQRIRPILLTMPLQLAAISSQADANCRFVEAPPAGVHAALRSRAASCDPIVQGYPRRREATDKPARVSAVSFTNSAAVDGAQHADARLANGDDLGAPYRTAVLRKHRFDAMTRQLWAGVES